MYQIYDTLSTRYRYISRAKGLFHRLERVESEAIAELPNSFRGVQEALSRAIYVWKVWKWCFIIVLFDIH